jgi:hypothetical protein
MSVLSTGRRPGTAVRRLNPEDAYSLPPWPAAAGTKLTARPRPGRARLRLVPPLPTRATGDRPRTPPRGRIPAPADARVLAPGAVPPARIVRPAGPPAHRGQAGRSQAYRDQAHPGQARRKVRLTRRGRLVVWALATLAAAALLTPVWLLAAAGAQAANHGLPPAAVHAGLRHIEVRPGQTLWSIAMAAEPTADPRVVAQEIMQVNALSSQVLVPGESLWVPAS